MELSELGWHPEHARAFGPYEADGCVAGRVAVEDKHTYFVVGAGVGVEWSAHVPGRLLHAAGSRAELPKVGDWVALRASPDPGKAVIEAVLPRRTQLARKIAGRQVEEQVLATNVDTAFIVVALDVSFNRRRLERFLVMTRDGGVGAVVLLNKADLGQQVQRRRREAETVAGGAPVQVVSARTGLGLGELKPWLRSGQTVIFVGASGVGKSSLINRLCGEKVQATLEVRESDAKGRHATAWREMIRLPGGGLVIDTPGMRELQVWMAEDGVQESFPDVEEAAVRCHFRGCTHTTEKRCAVLEAVATGTIPLDRLEAYVKLRRDLRYMADERRKHTYVVRRPGERTRRRALPEDADDDGSGS